MIFVQSNKRAVAVGLFISLFPESLRKLSKSRRAFTKKEKKRKNLVLGVTVMLINSTKEVVSLQQWPDIATAFLAGSKIHGVTMEVIKLSSNSLVEENENENRRFQGDDCGT